MNAGGGMKSGNLPPPFHAVAACPNHDDAGRASHDATKETRST
jgi:hypothetical protein